MVFCEPLILPAIVISTNASTYISVCTPKSLRSDSAIREPTALGIPPIPSCKQAPFGISSTISSATFLSTSVAAAEPSSRGAGLLPSTIISTSDTCTQSSIPPRQRGIFWLTSTMITSATSHTARICEA